MDEEGLQSHAEQPTSSCGRYANLNPARYSISAVLSTIIFNLKMQNDERYGTFQTDYNEDLDGRAQTDELFAVSYAKENKNLTIVSRLFSIK